MKKWAVLSLLLLCGCENYNPSTPASSSGVKKAAVKIETNPATGLTIEQENISNRLINDNNIGQIKHLYLVSPFTGKIFLYSAVKGKVTSSGKRLTPTTVTAYSNQNSMWGPQRVDIGPYEYRTNEVLQDDGTYGSSSEYIYFWDTNGVYRQITVGGATVIISNEPLRMRHADIEIVIDASQVKN